MDCLKRCFCYSSTASDRNREDEEDTESGKALLLPEAKRARLEPQEPSVSIGHRTVQSLSPAPSSLSLVTPMDIPPSPVSLTDEAKQEPYPSPWPTSALWQAFSAECQSLAQRFLHKALPGQRLSAGEIARPVHGAVHMSRAATWIPVLLTLYRDSGHQEALDFPADWVPYVMKAALLHDSGREGEGVDTPEWERASGERCEDHLRAIGCPPGLAAQCRLAIINKDKPHDQKSFIEKLVHDADCLEIIRVCSNFDIAQLDVYQDLNHTPKIEEKIYNLASLVRSVIAGQGDLSCQSTISNSQASFNEPGKHRTGASENGEIKTALEFAPNTLEAQVEWLKQHQPELYALYCKSAGKFSPTAGIPPLTSMERASPALGGSKGTSANGQYKDPVSGKTYYIKEPVIADSARNEVLMARLAGALGLQVPAVHLIQEQGRTCVVSEWQDDLTADQNRLEQADPEQLARLYLVAALLGNVDILGHTCCNTQVNTDGNLVALDWGEAGEFGAPLASARKTDSFSATVLELDTLLDAEHPAVSLTCHTSVMPSYHKATEVFSKLKKGSIEAVVKDLLQRDTSELSRLIEVYGPDKPLDRQRLQSIIHDRIAYLARRFPQCCQKRITPAEHKAMVVNGVRGHGLSVPARDITDGELCLFQFMNTDNQAMTECWLRLEPQAARNLSDQMGLPPRYVRLIEDINIYLKGFSDDNQIKLMTPQWQAILAGMVERCEQAISEIENNRSRLLLGAGSVPSQEAENMLNKTVTGIDLAAYYFRQLHSTPPGTPLKLSRNEFSLSDFSLAGFPVRVSSQRYECNETTHFALRNLRCSHGWNQGTQEHGVRHYRFTLPDLPDVEIQWFGDEQTKNMFALERVLVLRVKGSDRETAERILSGLSQLGVATARPDCDQVQTLYAEHLARGYQGGVEPAPSGMPPDTQPPRWEHHHQMKAGRMLFYRPEGLWNPDSLSPSLVLVHQLNFINKSTDETILTSLLHSGGQLLTTCERARMGIKVPPLHETLEKGGLLHDMASGGATRTCFAVKNVQALPHMIGLVLKPEILGRTDLTVYPKIQDSNTRVSRAKVSGIPPGPSAWSSLGYDHEITCAGISMEEVASVQIPHGRALGLHQHHLTSLCDYWPDGRPVDTVVKANLESFYKQLINEHSPLSEQSRQFVKTLSSDQLGELLLANPNLLNDGQIKSLQGVHIGESNLHLIPHLIELKKVNLSGVIFRGIYFNKLHNKVVTCNDFQLAQLTQHNFTDMVFEDCFPYWLNCDELRSHVYRYKDCSGRDKSAATAGDNPSKEIDTLLADILLHNKDLGALLHKNLTVHQFRLLMLCHDTCALYQYGVLANIVNNSINKAGEGAADQYAQVAIDVCQLILKHKDSYKRRNSYNLIHALWKVFIDKQCHLKNRQLTELLIKTLQFAEIDSFWYSTVDFQSFLHLLESGFQFTALEIKILVSSFIKLLGKASCFNPYTNMNNEKNQVLNILFKLMRVSGQPDSSAIYIRCCHHPWFRSLTRAIKNDDIVLKDIDLRMRAGLSTVLSGMHLVNWVFTSKSQCSTVYGAFIDAHIEFTDDFKKYHPDLYQQSLKAFENIDLTLRTGVEKCRSAKVDRMTKEEVRSVAEWLMSSKIVGYEQDSSPLSGEKKEELRGCKVDDEKAWRSLLIDHPELTKRGFCKLAD